MGSIEDSFINVWNDGITAKILLCFSIIGILSAIVMIVYVAIFTWM